MAKNKAEMLADVTELVENIEDMIETLEDIVEDVKEDVLVDGLAVQQLPVEYEEALEADVAIETTEIVEDDSNVTVLPLMSDTDVDEDDVDETNAEEDETNVDESLAPVYTKEPRCTCYGPVIHIQNMSGRYDQCTVCGLKK